MHEIAPEPELAVLLTKYEAIGGVLDYVFLEADAESSSEQLHRNAALTGMAIIDRRLHHWAMGHASKEHPIERFFRLNWDEIRLTGGRVTLSTFWGSDDVDMKPIGHNAWSIPDIDGYKPAFFHPPHGLRGSSLEKAELFTGINQYVLGDCPERAEIFSWSTDWSNYFEAGLEWWGAFFWTIHVGASRRYAVIGGSSTD